MTPLSYIHEDQCWTPRSGSQELHKERTACRYYQTGNCRRGSNCPFAHVSIMAQVEPPTIPHQTYPGENVYAYYPVTQNPIYHPLSSLAQPFFLWQPYPPLSPAFDPRYGLVCQTENLPDYPDDKSDPSSATSSSTATSVDCQLRMALDTAWLEGLESGTLRGVADPHGDLGTSPSPGYPGYSYPVFPGVQTEGVVPGMDRAASGRCLDQGSMAALPSPFLLPWQDDSRRKPLAYKTKPCKFYAANGNCTSGEKCTFIHDPESKGDADKPLSKLTPPTDVKLPPKPIDKYDDCRSRDFYPVTWRVIGGGVMMGGKRQVCPAFAAGQCKLGIDCKFAHETELETDDVGFIETKNEPVRKGQASLQQGAKGTSPKRVRASVPRKSGKVPPAETPRQVVFPSTTPRPQKPPLSALEGTGAARKKGNQVAVSSAPASPVHRRTRSMSMVTSPPPVDTTYANYAAEL